VVKSSAKNSQTLSSFPSKISFQNFFSNHLCLSTRNPVISITFHENFSSAQATSFASLHKNGAIRIIMLNFAGLSLARATLSTNLSTIVLKT